ncbi:hypothetical protein NKG05_25545 [Oerskovia sp. M15]
MSHAACRGARTCTTRCSRVSWVRARRSGTARTPRGPRRAGAHGARRAVLNPDSAPSFSRPWVRRVGVKSTRKWDLERVDHPVVAPLLEYKKLSRSSRPTAGTGSTRGCAAGASGPSTSSGSRHRALGRQRRGALQLPHQVRAAVVADPGGSSSSPTPRSSSPGCSRACPATS